GVAVRNGELWVAVTRGNCVQRFRRENGQLEQEIAVGVAPYGLCFPQPDRCYVSNWGGDAPKEGERQAKSSGTSIRVDSRGITSQGTASVLREKDGRWQQVKTITVGLHPSGLVASRDGRFVYVANANSDT